MPLGAMLSECRPCYSLKAAIGAEGMAGDIIPISMMYVKLTLPLGMSMMIVHLLHGLLAIPKGQGHRFDLDRFMGNTAWVH